MGYVLVCWPGFVVISCDDNAGSWCDLTDVDLFPTMINFADRQETLTGCVESTLQHWFIHWFIVMWSTESEHQLQQVTCPQPPPNFWGHRSLYLLLGASVPTLSQSSQLHTATLNWPFFITHYDLYSAVSFHTDPVIVDLALVTENWIMSLWFPVAGQRETQLTQLSKDKLSGNTSTVDNEAVIDSQGDFVYTVVPSQQ